MKEVIGKIRSCSIGWWVCLKMSQRTHRATDTRSFPLEEELVQRPREGRRPSLAVESLVVL